MQQIKITNFLYKTVSRETLLTVSSETRPFYKALNNLTFSNQELMFHVKCSEVYIFMFHLKHLVFLNI